MDIDVDAYLNRIGGSRPARPDIESLRELHVAHLRTVPFENLSIHLGEDIVLEREALVAKIVDARRGGFCYELNGAFGALLSALGYEVTLLQARVYGDEGRLGIPYDHMALRVEAQGGPLLVDVGFGAHSHYPLELENRGEQHDPGGVFRIEDAERGDLRVLKDGEPEYLLDQRPRDLEEFRAGAWYHRTSPESTFTRSLVCSRLTGDGRITLSGSELKTTVGGERTTVELGGRAEILAAYAEHFGIVLDRVPVLKEGSVTE
ncbi:arylamine N-acetyltransferase family protein [Streptomyces cavernicola]|uniref:Arylamine N-acetyltransferase n=1 Tax=Streptomyces cavernicola TaxID=3043613 RepID=A0ABT6SFD4_9ACTN|nr:arylamine N-acetyltransferase [Streptomyces sp. B-S-A6]MDI3406387.1 arylamine N-acetyltransferase [Streptomyces sp. B-S-A6]